MHLLSSLDRTTVCLVIQINAALLLLALYFTSDESVALRMLSQGLLDIENLASLWAASGEGEPIPGKSC